MILSLKEILSSLITPPIDVNKILSNEAEIYENERKAKIKTNKKASEKAQKLFNEISRTYETIWDNQTIFLPVINVKIKEPYNPEDCEGGDAKSLERIKIVVYIFNISLIFPYYIHFKALKSFGEIRFKLRP